MADKKTVKPGNISTYQDAPDEFLVRRKQDLQAGIRSPHLSAMEFLQEVFSRVAITAVVTLWSAWNGIDRLIRDIPSITKSVRKGRIHFRDEGEIRRIQVEIEEVAKDFSAYYFKGSGTRTAERIAQKIIDIGLSHEQPMKTGHDDLRAFIKECKHIGSEEEKRSRLLKVLQKAKIELKTSLTGQYFDVFTEIERRVEESLKEAKLMGVKAGSPDKAIKLMYSSHSDLARSAASHMERSISQTFQVSNRMLIDQYRKPATVILVAGAALATGYASYRAARRQKSLDQESELSHIERLQAEREKAHEEKAEDAKRHGIS